MRLFRMQRANRVYVDAKIIGRHDPKLAKRTLVGYVVENSDTLHGVCEVDASETDDAELQAILFAIRELKDELKPFTVICDHESVVSEVKKGPRETPNVNSLLEEVWSMLNQSIRVEAFQTNPAHKLLSQYLLHERQGKNEIS